MEEPKKLAIMNKTLDELLDIIEDIESEVDAISDPSLSVSLMGRVEQLLDVYDELYDLYDSLFKIWYYRPGSWTGGPVFMGSAEGCVRTLVLGTKKTGHIVIGLYRMRYSNECPDCRGWKFPRFRS